MRNSNELRRLWVSRVVWAVCWTFSLTLAWVEFGAMFVYGAALQAYPSGWPLCHAVFIRARMSTEMNFSAMVVNGIVCMMMLFAVGYVTSFLLQTLIGLRQASISDYLTATATAALLLEWLLHEQRILENTLGHIWVVRKLWTTGSMLTHWAFASPGLEWGLRLILLYGVSCSMFAILYMPLAYVRSRRRLRLAAPTGRADQMALPEGQAADGH